MNFIEFYIILYIYDKNKKKMVGNHYFEVFKVKLCKKIFFPRKEGKRGRKDPLLDSPRRCDVTFWSSFFPKLVRVSASLVSDVS